MVVEFSAETTLWFLKQTCLHGHGENVSEPQSHPKVPKFLLFELLNFVLRHIGSDAVMGHSHGQQLARPGLSSPARRADRSVERTAAFKT